MNDCPTKKNRKCRNNRLTVAGVSIIIGRQDVISFVLHVVRCARLILLLSESLCHKTASLSADEDDVF